MQGLRARFLWSHICKNIIIVSVFSCGFPAITIIPFHLYLSGCAKLVEVGHETQVVCIVVEGEREIWNLVDGCGCWCIGKVLRGLYVPK